MTAPTLRSKKLALACIAALGLLLSYLSNPEWAAALRHIPQLLTGSVSGWPITGGFAANVFISVVGMAIATVLGAVLGFMTMARARWVNWPARFIVNVLRNSPWLVLLFSTLYLLPFTVRIGPVTITLPPIAKAIFGLMLPVAANFGEVVRGAVQSIHSGQWESARSLGYSRAQIYRYVILPQAYRRMLPGWMNLYALLMVATALATVTGVQEVITVMRNIFAVEKENAIIYYYIITLAMFFLFCYPIARFARKLENAAKGDAL